MADNYLENAQTRRKNLAFCFALCLICTIFAVRNRNRQLLFLYKLPLLFQGTP